MALETNDNNEAFLSGGGGEDDFAALDSMGLTGQSYGMNTVHMSSSIDNVGSNNVGGITPATTQTAGAAGGVSDGTSGFSGVSGSLFDRIKARTAEQQKASVSNTQQQPAPIQQEAAQSSSQQSVFMSQQQSQQPPSGEVTMELERHRSDEFNSSAPTNLSSGMTSQQNTAIPNNNETTYSFSASGGGEDFSQQAQQQMHVPDYGVNRYAGAAGNQQQQYPQNIQDQALNTMKSLWSTGVNSAQNTIAIAQQKMGIESSNESDATPRSYNNNFLLREDSMESGGIGATMQQQVPPQPISAAQFDPEHVQAGSSANASGMSGIMGEQGYSMLQYGKTFCEDMYAFVMQLPPVGKGAVGIILLWILYVLFG